MVVFHVSTFILQLHITGGLHEPYKGLILKAYENIFSRTHAPLPTKVGGGDF